MVIGRIFQVGASGGLFHKEAKEICPEDNSCEISFYQHETER